MNKHITSESRVTCELKNKEAPIVIFNIPLKISLPGGSDSLDSQRGRAGLVFR